MKTSKLLRAALPLLAVIGFASTTHAGKSHTFLGKHIFNYVEGTTDLTPGYTKDSIQAELVSDRPFFSSDGTQNLTFENQERLHTKRHCVHWRSVTNFRVYEGSLTHSFLEISSGISISSTDRARYQIALDRQKFINRFGFAPAAEHFFTSNVASSGHEKANNDWEGQIIVGYDLSKTRPGNKAATFEPFAGYFWIHTKTKSQPIPGEYLSNEPAGFIFVPARAFVQSLVYWHGFVLGIRSEVTWRNFEIALRGQANFCRARSHEFTTSILGTLTDPNYSIMHERISRFSDDKDQPTWRYLGYTASIIVKRYIPLTNWAFFVETKYTHMRDKRYTDRVFQIDHNGTTRRTDRIEKLWHRRAQGHVGVCYSY